MKTCANEHSSERTPPPHPANPPCPTAWQSLIRPCFTVCSLFCFVATEAAGGRVERDVCGLDWVAIGRGKSGEAE